MGENEQQFAQMYRCTRTGWQPCGCRSYPPFLETGLPQSGHSGLERRRTGSSSLVGTILPIGAVLFVDTTDLPHHPSNNLRSSVAIVRSSSPVASTSQQSRTNKASRFTLRLEARSEHPYIQLRADGNVKQYIRRIAGWSIHVRSFFGSFA